MRVRIENEDPWKHGKYPPRIADVQLPPGLLGRLLTSLPSNASTTAPGATMQYYLSTTCLIIIRDFPGNLAIQAP